MPEQSLIKSKNGGISLKFAVQRMTADYPQCHTALEGRH